MSCQPQTYQKPHCPSEQLKVVFDYIDQLESFDFDKLTKLTAPEFTQQTLPASLGVPLRTKEADIAFLHNLRDSLKGVPMEIIIYDVNETVGKIWVHLYLKTVNIEEFLNFKFGTGEDKNLVVNVTEFVDSKVYASRSGGGGGNGNAQQETPAQASSTCRS